MTTPEQMPGDRFNELRTALAAISTQTTALPEDLSHELMRLAVVFYARSWEERGGLPIADSTAITATEAVVAASGLIRALNIELFELAMWQTQVGA